MSEDKVLATTPFHDDPFEYVIVEDEDGVIVATNPLNTLTVLPDGKTKVRKRRSIHMHKQGDERFETVLFGELDGVRVYIKGNQIILTKQNLRL